MRCKDEFLVHGKSDKYKALKDSLPAIMFNGYFPTGRNLADLKESSGVMVLDIDGLNAETFAQALEAFKNCEFTYAVFRSPSYFGLKVLFIIPEVENNMEFKEYFAGSEQLFKELLGGGFEGFDKSSSNLNRLCYWNYDPDIFINTNATVFTQKVKREVSPPAMVQRFAADHKEHNAVTALMENKLSKLADNIRTTPDGEKHHAINVHCTTMGGYCGAYPFFDSGYVFDFLVNTALSISTKSEREIKKQVRGAFDKGQSEPLEFPVGEVVNAERPEFFKELTYLLRIKKFKKNVLGGKNGGELLARFASYACEHGIGADAVVKFMIETINTTMGEFEVNSIIRRTYEGNDLADSKSIKRLQPNAEKVEENGEQRTSIAGKFLDWLIGKNVVVNSVTGDVIIDGKEVKIKTLHYHCLEEIDDKAQIAHVHAALSKLSDMNVGTYSPAISWCESLPQWDGVDHVGELLKSFVYKHDEHREFYNEMFRKHLIRGIRMVYEPVETNRYMIVLTSSKQGIGKTRLFGWLTDHSSTGEITLGGQERHRGLLMCSKMCCYLDEMVGFSFQKQGEIKNLVSMPTYSRRIHNSDEVVDIPRTSTLFGCTNEDEFLKDNENKRYLPFSLKDITWRTYTQNVDAMQIWAQAKHLYEGGENGELTIDEEDAQNFINRRYHQSGTVAESILEGVVRPIEATDKTIYHVGLGSLVSVVNNMTTGGNVKPYEVKAALALMGVHDTTSKAVEGESNCKGYAVAVDSPSVFEQYAYNRDDKLVSQLYAYPNNARVKARGVYPQIKGYQKVNS
tara:strand:+ start:3994 stop:6378 length:2385 start_codon:yes stop_codon:yes gene_type:complete